MNTLRSIILSGILIFNVLPFLHWKAAANPTEITSTVKSSFCLDNQYYVCLGNNSCFILNKVLIHKASGWFDVDKYGNPAASWLLDDPIVIERTGEYEWPFYIINRYTGQRALAALVDLEARNCERMHDKLRDLVSLLKEIQSDLSSIKYDVKSIRQEVLLKRPTPAN